MASRLFAAKDTLKGLEIASFRIPPARWQRAIRILAATLILVRLALLLFPAPPSPFPLEALVAISVAAMAIVSRSRICFHENGVLLPKNGGTVFLSRDQIIDMKLTADIFALTGIDASWGGPYSGGKYPVSASDAARFEDALGRFRQPN